MRKLAVAAALLIALLAGAALVLPRYVDWNALKPQLTAAAKRVTGRDIAVDGEVSVALLPKPVLTAKQVRLPGAADMPEPLRVEALELRLALAPLLTGDVRVERLRLIGPEIIFARGADGRHNWSWLADEAPPRLTLAEVTVERGSVVYRESDGREWRFGQLHFTAAVDTLAGLSSAQGRFVAAGLPLRFTLRLGRRDADGGLAVPKLTLALARADGSAEFRGRLNDTPDGRMLSGALTLRSRDLSRTADALGLPGLPSLPAVAETRLQVSRSQAVANDLSIRLADQQLNGAVRVSLGQQARFDAALTAGRLDLDSLLRPRDRQETAAGPAWDLWRLPAGLSGSLDLSIDGLGWRGAMMRQVRLSAVLANGRLAIEAARAQLPGGSAAALNGSLAAAGGTPRFDGQLELHTANLRRLLAWLGLDVGGVVTDRLAGLSLATGLSITPALLQAHGATLRLDGSSAEGGLTYRLQGRPSFGLDLALDRLDLDEYLRLPAAVRAFHPNLLRRFDSNLSLSAGQLTWGGRTLEGVALDLGLLQGQLTVREARIADLAGTELVLHASAGGFDATPSYIGDLQAVGTDPSALAEALGLSAPAGWSRLAPMTIDARFEGQWPDLSFETTGRLGETGFGLEGRVVGLSSGAELDLNGSLPAAPLGQLAAALGFSLPAAMPGALPVALHGRLTGDPALLKLKLKLDAEAAGANLGITGAIDAAAAPASFDLIVKGGHTNAADFLDRVGLGDLAKRTSGSLELSGRLTGEGESVRLDDIELRLGRNRLAGRVAVGPAGSRPRIEGQISVDELALAPWLSALSGGEGDEGAEVPRPFAFIADYDSRLELRAGTLAFGKLSLRDVAASLIADHGLLAVQQLEGRLFGGTAKITGRLVTGEPAALDMAATLDGADLGRAVGALLGNQAVDGRLSLTAELQGIGDGPAALARNLGGSLEIEASDGRIRGFGLAALDHAIGQGVAAADVPGLVERTLRAGPTRLLVARGRWRLADGVLATDDSKVSLEGGEARLAGELALDARHLALRLEVRPSALPRAPAIIVRLNGPAAAPAVGIEAEAFRTYLARHAAEHQPRPDRRSAP